MEHRQHSRAGSGYAIPIAARAPVSTARADLHSHAENSKATGPKVWKDIVLRVYRDIGKKRLLALAAGVTFYSILAIFPALAALVGIYGLFADPATISTHLGSVSDLLPGGAIDVIRDQMTRIASRGKSTLGLTFVMGLAVSLWSANAGVNAPPPKGGGFELRLKAGLVRLRRTQVTLKSSSGSGGVWFLMYSAQTSSDNDISSPKPDGTCSPKQYGCPVCTLPSFQSTRIMPRSHAA
jgi:Virulence factor BrkB